LPSSDGIEGAIAAGDVNLIDQRMIAQLFADLRAAVGKAQESAVDERLERIFEDRPEILVYRIHLENANGAVGDEFVEHVERRDRRDVAGAQHECDARLRRGLLVPYRRG
jgi:hypothetical protein